MQKSFALNRMTIYTSCGMSCSRKKTSSSLTFWCLSKCSRCFLVTITWPRCNFQWRVCWQLSTNAKSCVTSIELILKTSTSFRSKNRTLILRSAWRRKWNRPKPLSVNSSLELCTRKKENWYTGLIKAQTTKQRMHRMIQKPQQTWHQCWTRRTCSSLQQLKLRFHNVKLCGCMWATTQISHLSSAVKLLVLSKLKGLNMLRKFSSRNSARSDGRLKNRHRTQMRQTRL